MYPYSTGNYPQTQNYAHNQNAQFNYYPNQPQQQAPVANMTRCGIRFEQIRQDVVNILNYYGQAGNADVGNVQLLNTAMGHGQWQNGIYYTASVDTMVQTVAAVVDMNVQTNPNVPVQQHYTDALNEVYFTTWANFVHTHGLTNDPSINPSKIELLNMYTNILNMRVDMFNKMGGIQGALVNQNPTMTVNQFGGYSQQRFNHQNVNGMAPGMPMNQMNQYGTRNPIGANGIPGGNYFDLSKQGQPSQVTQPNQPQGFNPNGMPQIGSQVETRYDRMERIKKENQLRRAQAAQQPQVEAPVNEPTQSIHLNRPNPVTQTANMSLNIQRPSGQDTSTQPEAVETVGQSVLEETTSPTVGEFIYSKIKQPDEVKVEGENVLTVDNLENLFTLLGKEQANDEREGLKDDEVAYLTFRELRQAYAKGIPFEKPYKFPLTANPNFYHVHAVLTKEGTVRQYLHQIGDETMDVSKHADILDGLRRSRVNKEDIMAHRHVTSSFHKTTLGGIVYDRFKEARDTLHAQVSEAMTADEAERETKVNEAFEDFDENIRKGIADDYSGLTRFKLQNPKTDDETEEEYEAHLETVLPEDVREDSIQRESALLKPEEYEEVLPANHVADMWSAKINHDLMLDLIENPDHNVKVTTEGVETLTILNQPVQLEEYAKLLKRFAVNFNEVDDLSKKENIIDVYVDELINLQGKIPVTLWSRLNQRATRIINDALKHVIGQDIRIDSFVEDGKDLMLTVIDLYEDKVADIRQAFGILSSLLASGMKCLNFDKKYFAPVNEKEAVDDNGYDHLQNRALQLMNYRIGTCIPTTAEGNGLTQDVEVISYDSYPGLWNIAMTMLEEQITSRVSRRKHHFDINAGIYFIFGDGIIYRIYPRVGDNLEKTEGEEGNWVDYFTLVKEPVTA